YSYDDDSKVLKFVKANNKITTVAAGDDDEISYAISDYSGGYDGEWHTVGVNVIHPAEYTVSYSMYEDSGFLTTLVENQTKFKDPGVYEVYVEITSPGFDTVVQKATVNILKQNVYIREFPTISGLTIRGGNYSPTLAVATISGGVAVFGDFEIAGHFEWVKPTTTLPTSIGYYYYDMQFVPEASAQANFEIYQFTQLCYVDGYDELYYLNNGTYNGFYVHGNPENDVITDEYNKYYTRDLGTAVGAIKSGGTIYMLSTYTYTSGFHIWLSKEKTVTIMRHKLNTNIMIKAELTTSYNANVHFGYYGQPGTLIIDGNNVECDNPLIWVKRPSYTYYTGLYLYPGLIIRNHNTPSNRDSAYGAVWYKGRATLFLCGVEIYNCHGGGNYSPVYLEGANASQPATLTSESADIHDCSGYNGGAIGIGPNVTVQFYEANLHDNWADNDGGAVYSLSENSSALRILNLVNNRAGNNGGGAWFEGIPNIYQILIQGNTAANGGGLYFNTGVLDNTTVTGENRKEAIIIRGNSAIGKTVGGTFTAGKGGGIYFRSGFTLKYADIFDNSANGFGAGIYHEGWWERGIYTTVTETDPETGEQTTSTVERTDTGYGYLYYSKVYNNILTTASTGSDFGGAGIVGTDITLTEVSVMSNILRNNTSSGTGTINLYGAVYLEGGNNTISNSKIYNNSIYTNYTYANAVGVGVAVNKGNTYINKDSTISDNYFSGSKIGKYNELFVNNYETNVAYVYLADATISGSYEEIGVGGGGNIYLSDKLTITSAIEVEPNASTVYQNGTFDDGSNVYIYLATAGAADDVIITIDPDGDYYAGLASLADGSGKSYIEKNASTIFVIRNEFNIVATDSFTITLANKGTLLSIVYWDPVNGSDNQPQQPGSLSYPVRTLEKAIEISENNAIIYMLNTFTVNADMVLSATSVKLVRHTQNVLIKVTNGATLTLKDIVIDGNKVEFESIGSIIQVDEGSTLIIQAGAVLMNNNNNIVSGRTAIYGGAINNAGTLIINGGIISGNFANENIKFGGAIYSTGSVTINGGLIYENSADAAGGAIYIASGTLTINSGDIFLNSATENEGQGGAIYIAASATLNVLGGSYMNNTAKYGGVIYSLGTVKVQSGLFYKNAAGENGGVIFSAGSLIVDDGEFASNSAKSGGAVYLENGTASFSEFVSMYENSVVANGGAIYSASAKITINGGIFNGNIANQGGAIFLNTNAGLNFIAGEIYENEAVNGGAIYSQAVGTLNKEIDSLIDQDATVREAVNNIRNSNFVISGGYIYNNKTTETGLGGAIYLYDTTSTKTTMLLTAGEIYGNQAASGGAIYVEGGAFVELNGNVKIYNNSAKRNDGGAIYLGSGKLLLVDGEIYENDATVNGGAIYITRSAIQSFGAEFVVLGGKITQNVVTQDLSGAVHFTSTADANTASSMYVGDSAYIAGNLQGAISGNDVYVDTNATITVLSTLNSSASIGVETPNEVTTKIATAFKDFEMTSKKILSRFFANDSLEDDGSLKDKEVKVFKRITLNQNCIYLGISIKDSIKYIATDYIGDYDGASHSIGFELISPIPTGLEVQFVAVASPTESITESLWKSENPTYTEGTLRYVFFRFKLGGSTFEGGYRVLNIRNIIPELMIAPYTDARPTVGQSYSSTSGIGGSDGRPNLLGGRVEYNGRQILGEFIWTNETLEFPKVGMNTQYVTFRPYSNAYSSIDFTIEVRAFTDELYFIDKDGTVGFYLKDKTSGQYEICSDVLNMEQAISFMGAGGKVYIGQTYVFTATEYLSTADNLSVLRFNASFKSALFSINSGAKVYFGIDRDGNEMTGTITMDGGAVWKNTSNTSSSPNANNYDRNEGVAGEEALVLVANNAELYLYKGITLTNNENAGGASSTGGAIYCAGKLYINGATISRNLAAHGGGIALFGNAYLEINSGKLENNATYSATKKPDNGYDGYAGGNGGAIYTNSNGTGNIEVLITAVNILNNKASNDGGAIYLNGVTAEFVPVDVNGTLSKIEIYSNNTGNRGTIFVSNIYETKLTIEGGEITSNTATSGSAIWYSSFEEQKDLIFKHSDVGAKILVEGEIFLDEKSIIVQQTDLDGSSFITIDTADSYAITRVVIEKVNYQHTPAAGGGYEYIDLTTYYSIKENADGFYLTEITTHGGNATVQIGNKFNLYLYFEYGTEPKYAIEVEYGKAYQEYIDGPTLQTKPDVTVMSKVGYEVSYYCFVSDSGAKRNNVTLANQIIYNSNIAESENNIYTVWQVSTPIVTIVTDSDDNIETYGTAITMTASIANKNDNGEFTYTYKWFFDNNEIAGANSESYTIYNQEESGYYKVWVEVFNGSIAKEATTENSLITILPAQIELKLANEGIFTYNGTEINAKYVNGVDGELNVVLIEGQLKYSDTYDDLGIDVLDGTEKATNANVGNSNEMHVKVSNTNYSLVDETLDWVIMPLELEILHWYDVFTGEVYTNAYEQGESHLIVPIYGNLYVDGDSNVEKVVTQIKLEGTRQTGFTAYYNNITNGFVSGLNTNATASPSGFDAIGTYTTTIIAINNTNYIIPTDSAERTKQWNITGTQAFVERWKIGDVLHTHSDLADDNYEISKNYVETGYKITASMMGTNGIQIKENLTTVISVTGTTNSGRTYEETSSAFRASETDNLEFKEGRFITVTEAGTYVVRLTIIEYEKVTTNNELDFDSYYIKNADGTYTEASLEGTYDANAEYYAKKSDYFASPTAVYEITLIIEKDVLELTWGIDDVEQSSIVYDTKTHVASVIANNRNVNLVLRYLGVSSKKEAGEYTVTASLTADLAYNYVIHEDSETFTWIIEQAPLTISWPTQLSYQWNSKEQKFEPMIRGLLGSDPLGLSYEGNLQTEVGEYKCRIIYDGLNPNYTLGTQATEQEWAITQRELTFKWKINDNGHKNLGYVESQGSASAISTTYDGKLYKLEAEFGNLVENYDQLSIAPVIYSGPDEYFINAGLYTGTIDLTSLDGLHKEHYVLVANDTTTISWTIAAKEVTFIWNYTNAFEYDGQPHEVSAVVNPTTMVNASDTFAVTYSNAYIVVGEPAKYQESASAVGTYTAKIEGIGNPNYTFNPNNSTATQVWDIAKRKITLNWSGAGIDNLYYSGLSKYFTVTSMSRVLEEEKGNVTTEIVYKNGLDRVVTADSIKDVDTYVATATLTGVNSGNYEVESGETYTWTILPRILEFGWTPTDHYPWNGTTVIADVVSNKAQYYNFAITNAVSKDTFTLSVTVVIAGVETKALTVGYNMGTLVNQDLVNFLEEKSINVGAYSLTIDAISNSANYTLEGATNTSQSWRITPRTLDLTILSNIITLDYNGSETPFVYNAQNQTVTIKVRDEHNTDAFLVEDVGEGGHFTVAGNTQRDAGNYIASVSLDPNGNYVFTNGITTSHNWSVNWEISKLYAEFEWVYPDSSYTGSNKYVGAVVKNVQGTDTVNVVTYSTEDIPGAPAKYDIKQYTNVAINVGTYLAKVAELSNPNYMIDDATATFEWQITPRKAALTWIGTGIYSDSANYNKTAIYYSSIIENLVANTAVTLIHKYYYLNDTTWEELADETKCVKAGVYKCEVTIQGNIDYELPDNTEKIWTINQKTLTFKWSTGNLIYNGLEQNPVIEDCTGILSGDNVTYTDLGGDVRRKDVNNETTPKYTTVLNSLGGVDAANYTLEGSVRTSCEWTISPKPIEFNWQPSVTDSNWTYNRTAKYYSPLTIKGLVSGESVVYDISISYVDPEGKNATTTTSVSNCVSAGTYTMTIKGFVVDLASGRYGQNYTLSNYAASSLVKTWIISQAPVTFTWDNSTFQYEGAGVTKTVLATVVGAIGTDSVTVPENEDNYGYEENRKSTVGTYVAKVKKLSNINYTFNTSDPSTQSSWEWSITPKQITINWVPQNIVPAVEGVSTAEYNGGEICFVPQFGDGVIAEGENVVIVSETTLKGSSYLVQKAINAGHYETVIKRLNGSHASNYTLSGIAAKDLSKEWIITQIKLKFVNGAELNYTGFDQNLTVSLVAYETAGIVEGDSVKPLYDGADYYSKSQANTGEVGSETYYYRPVITLGGTNSANYQLVYIDGEQKAALRINPVEIKIVGWDSEGTYVYNGTNQYPTLIVGETEVEPGRFESDIKGSDSPITYSIQYGINFEDLGGFSYLAGNYRITANLDGQGGSNYFFAEGANNYTDYVIASKEVTYSVVALETGSATQADSVTTVLVVVYGLDNASAAKPEGTITFNYVTGATVGDNTKTVSLKTEAPQGDDLIIYNQYKTLVDLYFVGNYTYTFVQYTEYNEGPYIPALGYTCVRNNRLETYNYTSFAERTLNQTFYPSNQKQGELLLYVQVGSDYTRITADTTLNQDYRYGDTVTAFVTGGTDLYTSAGVKDNKYILLLNSIEISTSSNYEGANVTVTTDETDGAIATFKQIAVWSIAVVKYEIKLTKTGNVSLSAYKLGGSAQADDQGNAQTYVDVYSNATILRVGKKRIDITAPTATMEYSSGVLILYQPAQGEGENKIVLNAANLVFTSDEASILESASLVCYEVGYESLSAGNYPNYVSVALNHPNYEAGSVTKGILKVLGQPLTIDTPGIAVEFDDSDCIYNGQEQAPSRIRISYGTNALTYSNIVYKDNVNAGTASFTVTLSGNYKGDLTFYYQIKKLQIANAIFDESLTAPETYTSSSITKAFTYKDGDTDKSYVSVYRAKPTFLFLYSDFEIYYSGNINAGTATIYLSGKGQNVEGSHQLTFTINPMEVKQEDISDYTLVFDGKTSTSFTYSGSEIKPTVTYLKSEKYNVTFKVSNTYKYLNSDGNEMLDEDDNPIYPINVGSYFVQATIEGEKNEDTYVNYIGTVQLPFDIVKLNFSNNDLFKILSISNQSYQIGEVKPTVTFYWDKDGDNVVDEGELLICDLKEETADDYTVKYENNIAVGVATVIVEGIGNFEGTKYSSFVIDRRDISSLDIFSVKTQFTYTGRQIAPTVEDISALYNFDVNEEIVTFDILDYGDNVDAGTKKGIVIIEGTGNYKGEKEIRFDIGKLALSDDNLDNIEVVLDASEYHYTGSAIEPQVLSIAYEYITPTTSYVLYLRRNTDFSIVGYTNNTNASAAGASIEISLQNSSNFSGTINSKFYIQARVFDKTYFITTKQHTDPDMPPVTTITDEFVYTAEAITPTIYVYHYEVGADGKYIYTELVPNTDYTVNYFNNIDVGVANIQVIGSGNYTSSISNRFNIEQKDISEVTIADIADVTYTGLAIIPQVKINFGDADLVLNTDYTVTIAEGSQNIAVGKGKVTITGLGNYNGTIDKEFNIVPKNISTLDINISAISKQEYTGEPITPTTGIIIVDGAYMLELGVDYEISYSKENINVGSTSMLILTGIGNYTGTKSQPFEIVARNMENHTDEFTFELLTSKYYSGQNITLNLEEFVVKYKGTALAQDGTDYNIKANSYENNLNAGIASFEINGNGNFTGTLKFEFDILALPYGEGDWSITLTGDTTAPDNELFRYTSNAVAPKPVIKLGETLLVEGTDYELSYVRNQGISHRFSGGSWICEADSETLPLITIKFIGNYTGTTTKTFGIARISIDIDDLDISMKNNIYYIGKEVDVSLDNVSIKLKATTASPEYEFTTADVTITNSSITSVGDTTNNTDVGTGAIQILFGGANGIYTGTIIFDFEIKQLDLSSTIITIDESLTESMEYTSFELTKDFVNKIFVNGTVLEKDVDFTVSYTNNTFASEPDKDKYAVITLTAIEGRNVTGTRDIKFVITAKPFNNDNFAVLAIASQEYNYGQPIEIEELVKVTFTKADTTTEELVLGRDFYVAGYENNIN
ncbi:MAG: hypothetical protein IKA31_05930, partial [Clostridia bacterium]|nr:hypothetical protein [Clostridia bacterium]